MARFFALPLLVLVAVAVVFRLIGASAAPGPVAASPEFVAEALEPAPEPAPPTLAEEAPVPVPATPPPPVAQDLLTTDELKRLAQAGFSDETILAYARATGRAFRPTPENLIALKEAGLTDALLGRLMGAPAPPVPDPAPAATPAPPAEVHDRTVVVTPPPVYVYPMTTVYSPVNVTVVEAPPPPEPVAPAVVHTVVVCVQHRRPGCCVHPVPARLQPLPQEPPFFKTYAWMPTKRLPTAEEVARREEARRRW